MKYLLTLLFLFSTQGISQETYYEDKLDRELYLLKFIIQNLGPFFLAFLVYSWIEFHSKFRKKQNLMRMKRYIAESIYLQFIMFKSKKEKEKVLESFFKTESKMLTQLYNATKNLDIAEGTELILKYIDYFDINKRFKATPEFLNYKNYKKDDKSLSYFKEVFLNSLSDAGAKTGLIGIAYIIFVAFRNLIGF